MLSLKFLPRARLDLENIYQRSQHQFGRKQADRYVKTLYHSIETLREFPDLGSGRSLSGISYRIMQSGSHRIWYRRESDTIFVDRILHTSQDPSTNL